MGSEGMEALNEDLTRLERQIADLKSEMLHDREEVCRLQRRLGDGEAKVSRLREHLDRLWALRVIQHERELPSAPGEVILNRQPSSPTDPVPCFPVPTIAGNARPDASDAPPLAPQREAASPATDSPPVEGASEASVAVKSYIPAVGGAAGELAAFLATLNPRRKDFSGMERRSDGTAPDGFAQAVRQVAHRSIARAGCPLDRNAIFAELKASGVELPAMHAKLKVSKILTRDPDLRNLRGSGYFLNLRGLKKQLWEIRSEIETSKGRILSGEFWGRWDKDDGTPDL